MMVVAGNVIVVDAKELPQVIVRAVPSSRIRISSKSPSTGVPVRPEVIDVMLVAKAEIIKRSGIECPIKSIREADHTGTHMIRFESEFETIEIKHEAKSRDVFCIGAIYSAEWLSEQQKPGVYFYL